MDINDSGNDRVNPASLRLWVFRRNRFGFISNPFFFKGSFMGVYLVLFQVV